MSEELWRYHEQFREGERRCCGNCCLEGINPRRDESRSVCGGAGETRYKANVCGWFHLSKAEEFRREIFRYAMILQGLVGDIIYGTFRNRIRRARGFIVALHALVITQPRINFAKLHRRWKKKKEEACKTPLKRSYYFETATVILKLHYQELLKELSYGNYFC